MYYYQFNIGDYKSHTEHLSEMEDLTYRRLLDWYYLHEKPIPLEINEVARQIRMRSHTDCITLVLQEYFERTENGWVHHRADAEIAKAGEKSSKASESAKARWNKVKDANALRTESDSNATHNPLPNTQDPVYTGTDVPVRPADAEPAPKIPDCDHQAVKDLYHQLLPNLPACEVWNETRAGYLRQRWRDVATDMAKTGEPVTKDSILDFWRRYFTFVGKSKFLTGRAAAGKDRKPFLADLEWLIRPTNFAKVIEKRYHGD